MGNEQLMVHFHPEERVFVDRVLEWIERAAEHHEVRLTDFMDPRQIYIVQTLANRHPDVHVRVDGGYPGAERQRACIAPDYVYLEAEPMNIQVLDIQSPDRKWLELEHGDFMGAILGLGIKRDKIGDIHVADDCCHVLVTDDISSFLDTHLQQVHRVPVSTGIVPLSSLRPVEVTLKPMQLSVASMRLDGIASDVYRLSRTKIVVPIKGGRCKVNWRVEEDPSAQLRSGDVVSLKGFGRFKVLEEEGVTKKGRVRVTVGVYV